MDARFVPTRAYAPTTVSAFARAEFYTPFFAALLTLLMSACDGPMSGNDSRQQGSDSLDAEKGKDKLNHYDFLQGSFLATGHVLDLAIDGSGFFILKNETRHAYFRRPADFNQDADGYLHLGNEKSRLQGIPLASAKNPYPQINLDSLPFTAVGLADLADIRWPFQDLAPPRASTQVKLARNLDSDAMGKGSILYSQSILHHAGPVDIAIGLRNAGGEPLGIQVGDVLTLSASNGAATRTAMVTIGTETSLGNFAAAVTAFLRSDEVAAGAGTTVDVISAADSDPLRGALCVYGNTAPILNFQVTSNRPISGPLVTRAFAVQMEIPAGTLRLAVATAPLRAPASLSDPLSELYDASGNGLGLESGDQISISGSIGGNPASNVTPLTYVAGPGGTTLGALLAKIKENFKLADRDGTIQNYLSVSVDAPGSDDNIPDGSILIRGQPETASAIRDVAIRATDANNTRPAPTCFNTDMNMTTLRDATDLGIARLALDVFDETGKTHSLWMRFIPTNTPGQWLWEAGLDGLERVLKGARGKLSFGADGSVSGFTTDGGGTRLEFDPMNGAGQVSLDLHAGGPGDFTGMTLFRSETTAAFYFQDGFAAGQLVSISIDENGIISGLYSNGKSRALFQIPLAAFPNPKGLQQAGANTFLETPESGKPVMSAGFRKDRTLIRTKTLEYLSEAEFAGICVIYPDCKAAP